LAQRVQLEPSLAQPDAVTPSVPFPEGKANEAVVVLQDEDVEPIVLRGAGPATTLRAAAATICELSCSDPRPWVSRHEPR
jgi:multiple sugar transport system substrate-binding protein